MLTPAVVEDLKTSIKPRLSLFECLRNKKILITGANGLIPGIMVATLAILKKEFGIPVSVLATYHNNRSGLDALIEAGYDNIELLQVELAEPFSIKETVDYIVHGASLASPRKYLANRMDTMKVNVQATLHLLEKAKADGVENMMYIGSGEIYGSPEPEFTPTKEDYFPVVNHLSDRACYVESKRFAESLCQQFSLETGQKVSVVRPIHVFGPGLAINDGRVIAEFLADAVKTGQVVVRSDGTDRRAFCYLLDANLMLWHVLLEQQEQFDVFNIGNPNNDVSIAELAQAVANITDASVDILGEKPAFAQGTPARSAPNIDKIQHHFGLAPNVSLLEGLQLTLNWMRDTHAL